MFGMLLNADSLFASVLNADLAIKCSCSDAIATNSEDTAIAVVICNSLFWISFVCIAGFLLWKIIEYYTNKYQSERENRWKDKNKEWELANQLIERYLDHLKSQSSDKKGQEPKKDIVDLTGLQNKAYQALEDASSPYRSNLQKILLSIYTEILEKRLNSDSGATVPTKDKSSQEQATTNPSKQERTNGESSENPSPTEPANNKASYEQVLAYLVEKLLSGQFSKVSLNEKFTL